MPTALTARYGSKCPRCKEEFVPGITPITQENGRWVHAGGCEAKQPEFDFVEATVENIGVYTMPDGTVCRIKSTKDGLRTYAERWHLIGGERITEAGPRANAEYEYVRGLAPYVKREGVKMTLEQATAFCIRYGVCARCARTLKAADSVERGIGPVCLSYFSSSD